MIMDKKYYSDEIAAHEAGHVFALGATGLADEFQSVTTVHQTGVQGLTIRNGESLMRMSMELAGYARRLADPTRSDEARKAFRDFLMSEAPKTCLPHVCFFFGGGSIDRFLGCETPERNTIDMYAIRQYVLPAMAIQILDHDLYEIQAKVDSFLGKSLMTDAVLFKRIYEKLATQRTITAEDKELMCMMRNCTAPMSTAYQELYNWFLDWYMPKVEALPYLQ